MIQFNQKSRDVRIRCKDLDFFRCHMLWIRVEKWCLFKWKNNNVELEGKTQFSGNKCELITRFPIYIYDYKLSFYYAWSEAGIIIKLYTISGEDSRVNAWKQYEKKSINIIICSHEYNHFVHLHSCCDLLCDFHKYFNDSHFAELAYLNDLLSYHKGCRTVLFFVYCFANIKGRLVKLRY